MHAAHAKERRMLIKKHMVRETITSAAEPCISLSGITHNIIRTHELATVTLDAEQSIMRTQDHTHTLASALHHEICRRL
jgi:peptide deformylase